MVLKQKNLTQDAWNSGYTKTLTLTKNYLQSQEQIKQGKEWREITHNQIALIGP